MSYSHLWKLASWIYTVVLWFVNHQSHDNCQVRSIKSVRSAKTWLNISLNTSSVCPGPEFHEWLPRQTRKGPENLCESSADGLKEEYYRFTAKLSYKGFYSVLRTTLWNLLYWETGPSWFILSYTCLSKGWVWLPRASFSFSEKKHSVCQFIPLSCGLQNQNLRLHTGLKQTRTWICNWFQLDDKSQQTVPDMCWVAMTNLTVACEALLVYRPDCDTGQLCGTWAVTSICRLFDANLLWIQEVTLYLHEISAAAAKQAVQRRRGRNLKL